MVADERCGAGSALTQEVIWEPQPGPQTKTKLLTCPCFEVFFGGARGGGKTDAVLGEFISHADLYGIDAIGLMVRRTRTELVETIERSRAIYLPLLCNYTATQMGPNPTVGGLSRPEPEP
jgi:hypothetical protein